MGEWNTSLWNEFEVRRERYIQEAANARLAAREKSEETRADDAQGLRPLALIVGTILLLGVSAGIYLASTPVSVLIGH